MEITLYNTVDEVNKVTKTLTDAVTYQGTLREETDVLNPSFMLQATDYIVNYNYAYIPAFKRYYFITGLTSVKNGLWRLSLDVDVLMTYATQIKELVGVVGRQQSKFNLYIQDPEFQLQSDLQTVTKKFPLGFSDYSYVLCTAGSSAIDPG